jgi:hypothetical protein
MTKYFKILIFLLLISCKETSSTKNIDELPDSNLINEVISVVIKTESLSKTYGVKKHFKVMELNKKLNWSTDSVPPPPSPNGPFSISHDELFEFFNSEMNSNLRMKDSLYINHQLNPARILSISESNSSYFSKNDESYYHFSLPVLSSDKKVVYVFYTKECGPLCGTFHEIVLERKENKWIKVHGNLCGCR